MLQQLGQPGGIGHIGLAAGQDLDLASVHQHQLEAPLLQHLPDRLPVLAGGFHHHLGDPFSSQPAGQRLQSRGEGRVGADLLAAAALAGRHPHTGHHLVLGHIQAGAPCYQQLHRRHLPCRWVVPGGADRSGDAERRAHSNSSWCREGPRVSLINGLCRTKESRAWPGHPILIPRGGHKPWRSYQLNAGNRCADGRFPRPCPTVGVKVECSHGVQLSALPTRADFIGTTPILIVPGTRLASSGASARVVTRRQLLLTPMELVDCGQVGHASGRPWEREGCVR
jgi:hypothetical protein